MIVAFTTTTGCGSRFVSMYVAVGWSVLYNLTKKHTRLFVALLSVQVL
jgi:hypothetical protein